MASITSLAKAAYAATWIGLLQLTEKDCNVYDSKQFLATVEDNDLTQYLTK